VAGDALLTEDRRDIAAVCGNRSDRPSAITATRGLGVGGGTKREDTDVENCRSQAKESGTPNNEGSRQVPRGTCLLVDQNLSVLEIRNSLG
jgi:hypothetical protein